MVPKGHSEKVRGKVAAALYGLNSSGTATCGRIAMTQRSDDIFANISLQAITQIKNPGSG